MLRDGAALIQGVDDVIATLDQAGPPPSVAAPSGFEFEDEPVDPERLDNEAEEIRERIAGLLSPSPVSRDELSRITGAPARAVLAALVELEIAGRAELSPNGMVRVAFGPED